MTWKNTTTFFANALLAVATAASEVAELTDRETLREIFEQHDFNVVSMYLGSDAESRDIDALMESTKSAFEELIKNTSVPERSVGWYRADIEKYPDLDFQGLGMADQMVMSTWHELSRFLHQQLVEDTPQQDAESFAALVRYLTGEYYTKLSCDEMQADDREFYDEVVYLGEADDLYGDNGKLLELLSMTDRFNFDQQRIGFYWNDEKDCKTQFGLDEDSKYLLMLNGLNSIESHIELAQDDYHSPNDLMFAVNTQVCKGTPRWSQRSYNVIFEHMQPALVLMLESGALVDPQTDSRNWRLALFAKITEWIQEYDTIQFVPVIAHEDREDADAAHYVWSLAELMQVDNADLPHIYMLDPFTHKAVPYPTKMDQIEDFSPELILAWADMVKAETDLERVKNDLKEADAELAKGTEEDDELILKEYITHLQTQQTDLEESIVGLKDEHESTTAELKEHGNDFAESHEEYFDIAELHLARIEQVMMEEL